MILIEKIWIFPTIASFSNQPLHIFEVKNDFTRCFCLFKRLLWNPENLNFNVAQRVFRASSHFCRGSISDQFGGFAVGAVRVREFPFALLLATAMAFKLWAKAHALIKRVWRLNWCWFVQNDEKIVRRCENAGSREGFPFGVEGEFTETTPGSFSSLSPDTNPDEGRYR